MAVFFSGSLQNTSYTVDHECEFCHFNILKDLSSRLSVLMLFLPHVSGVSVEGQDEKKIEEYLTKQGIASMQVRLKNVHSKKNPTIYPFVFVVSIEHTSNSR